MAYEKVGWKDGAEGRTPVSAANLNHMDNQIKENSDTVEAVKSDLFSFNDATGELIIDLDALEG